MGADWKLSSPMQQTACQLASIESHRDATGVAGSQRVVAVMQRSQARALASRERSAARDAFQPVGRFRGAGVF